MKQHAPSHCGERMQIIKRCVAITEERVRISSDVYECPTCESKRGVPVRYTKATASDVFQQEMRR